MECGEPLYSHEFLLWKRIFGDPKPTSSLRGLWGSIAPNTFSSPISDDGFDDNRLFHRRRTFREGTMVFAARLLMGATGYNDSMDEETGALRYSFTRPIGGHGKTFVDILHSDEQLRVMRGHAGTLYAFARVGDNQ